MKCNDRPLRVAVILFGLTSLFSTNNAFACCDEIHYYDIINVKKNDALNIRAHPNYKANRVGSIPGSAKGKVTIYESSAVSQLECVKKPVYDHKVIDQLTGVEDLEGKPSLKPLSDLMLGPPKGKSKAPRGTWCKINYKHLTGWVNAGFLKFRCSVEVTDSGPSKSGC
jgi:hypothetical protein